MCLPALAFVGAALGASAGAAAAVGTAATIGAIGVGVSAYGTYKAGQTAKQQAQLQALNAAEQAALASENATNIEKTGKINYDLTLAVGGLNSAMTQAVSDTNISILNATTDFNVGMIKATTSFNVSSAEGAAALLEARGEAEATVHRGNADLLEVQAQDTLEAGNQAERQSRAAYSSLKGSQRARMAANGATLDEGSNLRIQSDTDYLSDVDADTIKTNAMKAAFGYRVSAVQERTTAAFASLDGQAQGIQKRGEAIAARINGAAGIASAELDRAVKTLDNKMTTSVQILQTNMNAQIDALNIKQQTESDAWAARASAKGYQGVAAQARLTAKSTNPGLMAATSLASGASSLFLASYRG